MRLLLLFLPLCLACTSSPTVHASSSHPASPAAPTAKPAPSPTPAALPLPFTPTPGDGDPARVFSPIRGLPIPALGPGATVTLLPDDATVVQVAYAMHVHDLDCFGHPTERIDRSPDICLLWAGTTWTLPWSFHAQPLDGAVYSHAFIVHEDSDFGPVRGTKFHRFEPSRYLGCCHNPWLYNGWLVGPGGYRRYLGVATWDRSVRVIGRHIATESERGTCVAHLPDATNWTCWPDVFAPSLAPDGSLWFRGVDRHAVAWVPVLDGSVVRVAHGRLRQVRGPTQHDRPEALRYDPENPEADVWAEARVRFRRDGQSVVIDGHAYGLPVPGGRLRPVR